MSLVCKLVGHQFVIKHIERGVLTSSWELVRYKYCQRCGSPNPNWSEP